ncbi:AAA family ATPase [Haematomicrobium sanguinis]|uniref:AAA family ATPase n=1 Tax=Haematomicrobium sanguinis TaxID=479106 RepID=UPI00047E2560|nr:AAA family ATPase [Haematomicrobium sanguinis]
MALILVTGISGSGKSAILERLCARGIPAFGVDEDGFGDWISRSTGLAELGDPDNFDEHAWFAEHHWRYNRARVERLARDADRRGQMVFLCGNCEGEDTVWDLFDRVIVLQIDEATLRHRLETRTGNNYGKHPDELRDVLAWHEGLYENYAKYGATLINATRPLDEVVSGVLALSGSGRQVDL